MNWTSSFIPEIILNGCGFTKSNSDTVNKKIHWLMVEWDTTDCVKVGFGGRGKRRLGVAL